MEQMCINPERKVEIEINNETGKFYKALKPLIFEDDKLYCCLLGPDLKVGIKGFGHTPADAVEDWEISLRKRIATLPLTDEVASYAVRALRGLNGNDLLWDGIYKGIA